MDDILVQFLNGITYGMLLFLIASGLSLIFGVMGILNLAHGAFYMVGGFIGLAAARRWDNWWLGLITAGISIGLIGFLVERGLLKHLHNQLNEQVLLTLGLVHISSNLSFWIWGGSHKIGEPPAFLSRAVSLGGINYSIYRFAIILFGLIIFIFLWWLREKTRIGAVISAGIDDKEMTMALGINYRWISSCIFALGTFIVGLAGFIGAPIVGTNPGMSLSILLLALIVIIVGGVRYVQGALLGAVLIGLIDSFGKIYFPDFSLFTLYLVMIIILLVKPSGLLGKER